MFMDEQILVSLFYSRINIPRLKKLEQDTVVLL